MSQTLLGVLLLPALSLALVSGQTQPDVEQRLAALERRMKSLDPSFVSSPELSVQQRLQALEARMDAMLASKSTRVVAEAAPTPPAKPPVPVVSSLAPTGPPLQPVSVSGDFQKSLDAETRLPVAGYMDFHVNKSSGDAFRPDFHRFVLLFGHSFSDRIKFWSELEVEHALVEGGEESGEVAVEQAFLDFLIKPKLNVRAGMMLMPVGIVNERHEPPSFNGVERPFVDTFIIPTTWRELGIGFTGDLGKGFRYRTYLTSSLDASRFNAEFGIAEGRTSGFDSSMQNPAVVGRLEYAGIRRLTLGTSFYSGLAGFNTPGVNPRVTLAEVDGRYSYRRFDFRAVFANTWVSNAAALNQLRRRQTGVNPNVASQMRGYYLEPALHLLPRRFRQDLIAFGRYELYNTQQKMPAGYLPLQQWNRSSWVTGLTYKPIPDVAIKFDYDFNRNQSAVVSALNGLNIGIGWWF